MIFEIALDPAFPNPRPKVPTRAHDTDSGFDLYAAEEVTIPPGQRAIISAGVRLGLPMGWEAQIRPKSGMSSRGLDVAFGTVDAGYRGVVGVTVINNTGLPQTFGVHDKIGQMVIGRVYDVDLEVVDADNLTKTDRGENGWGSTGDR